MNPPLKATLIEGPVAKSLSDMAAPMVLGLLATMSFNFADTMFVGWLGEDPLAAMTFTFPVVMVVTSVAIGLGAGASSAIARAMGAGNEAAVRRLATDAITLATIISILVCVIGWFTIDPLFTAMGAQPEVLPLIHDYMVIWYLSAPFLMVPMISLSALRALGFARVQAMVMGLGAVLNCILDPLLIFGWGPIPGLEIQGAAIASLITRVLMLLGAIYYLQGRMHVLVSPRVPWSRLRESWYRIGVVGLPAMLSNLIIPIASFFVVGLVTEYGKAAVAGLGAAVRVEPIVLIAFYALSGVVGPFAGQNEGAGRHDRLAEMLRVVTMFCLGFGLVIGLALYFLAPLIATFFDQAPEAIRVIVLYLSLVPVSYGAYGLVMSIIAVFNGLGRPLPGITVSALRVLIVYLPLALLGRAVWGLPGLFMATTASNILVAVLAYCWLRHTLQKQARQFEAPLRAGAVPTRN